MNNITDKERAEALDALEELTELAFGVGGKTDNDILYLRKTIRKALETPRADAWQPIETAPKDGTRILTIGEEGFAITKWKDDLQMWFKYYTTSKCNLKKPVGNPLYKPTHWMPLPQPPKDNQDD